MEGSVGKAGRAVVWVVEELGVVLDDAGDKKGIVGVDCPAQAEGRIDPVSPFIPSSQYKLSGSYILKAFLCFVVRLQSSDARLAQKVVIVSLNGYWDASGGDLRLD